jgi:hypothetical protein
MRSAIKTTSPVAACFSPAVRERVQVSRYRYLCNTARGLADHIKFSFLKYSSHLIQLTRTISRADARTTQKQETVALHPNRDYSFCEGGNWESSAFNNFAPKTPCGFTEFSSIDTISCGFFFLEANLSPTLPAST